MKAIWVKTANGPVWLTVPVLQAGHLQSTVSDILIDNALPWRRKHWKTLAESYGKAPYFAKYAGFFEDVYARSWERLVDLNAHMLKWFLATLGIATPVRGDGEFDLQGRKSDLILDLCRKLGAKVFVFGALGRDYADVGSFEREGIACHFQDYRHPVYPQLHGDFVSHLSVVDLLFNCGDKSRDILMSGNLAKVDLLATQ